MAFPLDMTSKRGVRQGCPLSGILFGIAMELLGQSIRRSKDKKSVHIQGNEAVKLMQNSDDTTALLLSLLPFHVELRKGISTEVEILSHRLRLIGYILRVFFFVIKNSVL